MLSQTAEYALRAMVALGQDSGKPRTAESLSDSIQVPVPYLHKILRDLSKARLLNISRGRHGGFTLARSPEKMPLLEIIDAIAPLVPLDRCPLRLQKHEHQLCPLHTHISQAIQSLRTQFQNTTIADLLRADPAQPPLCQNAPAAKGVGQPPTFSV